MNYSWIVYPGLRNKPHHPDPRWRVSKIIEAACSFFEINERLLKSKKRHRHIVFPRQVAQFMLKKHANLGCVEIGKEFNQDHTSILHNIKTVRDLYSTDPLLREQIDAFENKILS